MVMDRLLDSLPAVDVPDEEVLVVLHGRLRELALETVRGRPRTEQVRLLHRLGYRTRDIADMLGVTSNAVSVALYKQRERRGELALR